MQITEHQHLFNRATWGSVINLPLLIPFDRKPGGPDDITRVCDETKRREHFGPYWAAIPEFTDLDLWGRPGVEWWTPFTAEAKAAMGYTPDGEPRHTPDIVLFILSVPEGRFLVNTEAGDYCRYATRLINP